MQKILLFVRANVTVLTCVFPYLWCDDSSRIFGRGKSPIKVGTSGLGGGGGVGLTSPYYKKTKQKKTHTFFPFLKVLLPRSEEDNCPTSLPLYISHHWLLSTLMIPTFLNSHPNHQHPGGQRPCSPVPLPLDPHQSVPQHQCPGGVTAQLHRHHHPGHRPPRRRRRLQDHREPWRFLQHQSHHR